MENGRGYGEDEGIQIEFELYDYVRDVRKILSEIHSTYEDSWKVVYEALCEFITQNRCFPEYREEFAGYKLGVWCSNQRQLRSANALSSDRIEKQDVLGFIWDTKDERWQNSFRLAKDYREKHGKFPSRTDTVEEAISIYQWISNQKQLYKKGELT